MAVTIPECWASLMEPDFMHRFADWIRELERQGADLSWLANVNFLRRGDEEDDEW